MIGTIKKGDTLKCLMCGKPIKLDSNTFVIDPDGEYIGCPHCDAWYDVQSYHAIGEFWEGESHETD